MARSFSASGKISAKVIVAGVLAAGAVVVTAGVAARESKSAATGEATQAAKKILRAAGAYGASSAQAGCPTITELMEARQLEQGARTEDAWGNRFRIVCDAAETRVISAGPDGRMGTSDDLRFAQ